MGATCRQPLRHHTKDRKMLDLKLTPILNRAVLISHEDTCCSDKYVSVMWTPDTFLESAYMIFWECGELATKFAKHILLETAENPSPRHPISPEQNCPISRRQLLYLIPWNWMLSRVLDRTDVSVRLQCKNWGSRELVGKSRSWRRGQNLKTTWHH